MGLIGPYTPTFSDSEYTESFWCFKQILNDFKEEVAVFSFELFKDQTCCVDGLKPFYFKEYSVSNSPEDLNEDLTWNGTLTVTSEGDPTNLSPGDWICHTKSRKWFEVDSILGSLITILDPNAIGVPDSSGEALACHKSSDPMHFRYFSESALSPLNKNDIFQAEEYLLNELPEFSGYIRV